MVQINCCLDEDYEFVRSMAKFMSGFGENFTSSIVKHISDPQVQAFLDLVYRCTIIPGTFGIDEEVSDILLYFWYLLEEGFHEHGDEASRSFATPIFTMLLKGLIQKCIFPPYQDWMSIPRDIRDKFISYRKECGETMLFCYYTLQTTALHLTSEMVENWFLAEETRGSIANRVESLEAILFAIRSFHESVDTEERFYLANLFDGASLKKLLSVAEASRDPAHRLRIVVCALIGKDTSNSLHDVCL